MIDFYINELLCFCASSQANILLCGCYREWVNEQQTGLACKETENVCIMVDVNFDMMKWDESSYSHRELSDNWRQAIAENGFFTNKLGPTYLSYYTKANGKQVVSALDHIYHRGK